MSVKTHAEMHVTTFNLFWWGHMSSHFQKMGTSCVILLEIIIPQGVNAYLFDLNGIYPH